MRRTRPLRETVAETYHYAVLIFILPALAVATMVLIAERVATFALGAMPASVVLGWVVTWLAIALTWLALHVVLLGRASWRAWDGALVLGAVTAVLALAAIAASVRAHHSPDVRAWLELPFHERWTGIPALDWRRHRHWRQGSMAYFFSTIASVLAFVTQYALRLLLEDRREKNDWFVWVR